MLESILLFFTLKCGRTHVERSYLGIIKAFNTACDEFYDPRQLITQLREECLNSPEYAADFDIILAAESNIRANFINFIIELSNRETRKQEIAAAVKVLKNLEEKWGREAVFAVINAAKIE